MSKLNNNEQQQELALYEIDLVEPIEDGNNNLVDFECHVVPMNIIAEIVDAGNREDFDTIEKVVVMSEEAKVQIEKIKEQYGDRDLSNHGS